MPPFSKSRNSNVYVCMYVQNIRIPCVLIMHTSTPQKDRESPFMNLPILLLLRPKSRQHPVPPLDSGNLDNNEADKVRQRPIATMRTEHIQILDVQRTAATREEVVDLAIVVEQ